MNVSRSTPFRYLGFIDLGPDRSAWVEHIGYFKQRKLGHANARGVSLVSPTKASHPAQAFGLSQMRLEEGV